VELAADWLRPICEQIRTGGLGGGYVQVGETPIEYLEPGHGKTWQGYIWTCSRPGGDSVYRWETTRAAASLNNIIPVGFTGVVQCDSYPAYRAFADSRDRQIQLSGCWAHVRGELYEALEQSPRSAAWSLGQIQQLYAVEAALRQHRAGPHLRAAKRAHHSQTVVQSLERALVRLVAILLDLTHDALLKTGDPSKFAPFVWQPEMRQMMNRVGLMRWRYWVPGLRYFGYYDWYLKDFLAEEMFARRKTVRGYTIDFGRRLTNGLDAATIRRRLDAGYGFSSNPDQTRLLFDSIRNTPNRTFIVVFSPLHSSCFANFRDAEGFARYLGQLRSFTNVVVLDWGRMELADDCFADTLHLNEQGAVEFSRRLADQLRIIRATAISNNNTFSGSRQ
jgi:hypothetical protein